MTVFWHPYICVFIQLSAVHRLLNADPSLVHCCDADGYTPLHRAAYSGHVDVVSALLAAGSKVNPLTVDGWTPLHSACRWSHVAVASFLLQRGAELNAQTNGGLTPLHLAASHTSPSKTDSANTLELLLTQRHLKPGLHSSSGETASEVARRSGPFHFLFEMVEECVSVTQSWTKTWALTLASSLWTAGALGLLSLPVNGYIYNGSISFLFGLYRIQIMERKSKILYWNYKKY